MARRINIRGQNLDEIKDKHLQLKERLKRSVTHTITDSRFVQTSYTDAIIMLTETDITIQYRQHGKDKLFRSDPNYHAIFWGHFLARTVADDTHYAALLNNPHRAFATMLQAVSDMGDIEPAELYSIVMNRDSLSYCGVRGSFQRVRKGDSYERCLYIDEITGIENLFEGAIKLMCVAIDAYTVNFLQEWGELNYGPPYDCMRQYLDKKGYTDIFSLQHEPWEGAADQAIEELIHGTEPLEREFSGLHSRFETTPATIDRNDETETHWRNQGQNRLLP